MRTLSDDWFLASGAPVVEPPDTAGHRVAFGSSGKRGLSRDVWIRKKYDVQLFPVVEGRITKNGVPQAGVTIIREATYDDAEIQEAVTGPDGRFSFPPWTIRSRTPGKAFVEDRLRQVLAAKHKGEQYLLWYYVTGRLDGEEVIAEKLGNLSCDLNDEEISYHFQMVENPSFTHNLASICRWEPDESDQ